MEDARSRRSIEAIKNAFLTLLEKERADSITMAQLAREAKVSRSTLYSHFGNVQDVYNTLVAEFRATLRPLTAHLHCADCPGALEGKPFCIALRNAGHYAPLVRDERFFQTLLELHFAEDSIEETLAPYRTLGISDAQARAAFQFQMQGCYAVAMSEVAPEEWGSVQRAIDTFIRGGMNALRGPIA